MAQSGSDRSRTNRIAFGGLTAVIVATVLVVLLIVVIGVLGMNFYDVTHAKANFELNIQALDLCRTPFNDYVGQPESESPTLTLAVDYPSEDEWRRGDRAVRCLAIAKDGAPALSRSVRDATRPAPA